MATVQAGLAWALNRMARGSQDCADTVKEVTGVMMPMFSALVDDGTPEQVAAVQPHLQDLVHAAGWLHQCIRPSSSLLPHLQAAALDTWLECMFWINEILFHNTLCDMADFLLLLEPRSRPQVPGGSSRPAVCCAASAPFIAQPWLMLHLLSCTSHSQAMQSCVCQPQPEHWAFNPSTLLSVVTSMPLHCACIHANIYTCCCRRAGVGGSPGSTAGTTGGSAS